MIQSGSYASRRLISSAGAGQRCKTCGGFGQQGLLGPRGFGWFASPCPDCSSSAPTESSISGFCSACTRRGGGEQSVEYIAPEPHIASNQTDAGSLDADAEDPDVYEDDDRAHSLGIYFNVHYKDHPDGDGFEEWADGAKYEGQFIGGLRHGSGKFVWTNGSSYSGDFVLNDMQGNGILTWSDGCRYQGQWSANSMHGEGCFSWTDGRTYKGQYVDDRRHGHGVFRWPDGSRFDGQWRVGRQDGNGMYVTAYGQLRKGEWRDGRRNRWILEV